jgi:predicted GIY-YIG superfamily endonuclease
MYQFHVYILRYNDGSYYVGHTDDIERRMENKKVLIKEDWDEASRLSNKK